MYTAGFWKDVGERSAATFAQALIAAVGVSYVAGQTGVHEVDWADAASVAALAAVLALLKGIAAALAKPETGASIGTTVPADTVRKLTHGSSTRP